MNEVGHIQVYLSQYDLQPGLTCRRQYAGKRLHFQQEHLEVSANQHLTPS